MACATDVQARRSRPPSPREIEEVPHEHQAVAEVAVIGIPLAELGEEVGAAVQAQARRDSHPGELRAFARERWRPTSTRAMSGSCASCPRAPLARSSTAKCSRRKTSSRDRERHPAGSACEGHRCPGGGTMPGLPGRYGGQPHRRDHDGPPWAAT